MAVQSLLPFSLSAQGQERSQVSAPPESWFTVRSPFFHDQAAKDGNVNAIRQGEAAGTIVTVLEGVAASWLTKSWLPFVGAVAISAIMVAGYEYSISHPASEHTLSRDDRPSKLGAFRYSAAQ